MKNYKLKINDHDYEVTIGDINESSTEAVVTVNGVQYTVGIEGAKASKPKTPQVAPSGIPVTPATVSSRPAAAPKVAEGGYKVVCPLPGTVTAINVKEGDTVAAGQTVVVLEAMKMSNNIDAEKGGVVKSIKVAAGATVMEGDVIMVIE